MPAAHLGHDYLDVATRGGEKTDARKGAGLEAEGAVFLDEGGVCVRVGFVEPEQVLALHIKDKRAGVGGVWSKRPGVEERVEEKSRVARFGGHPGDAADGDMSAAGPVEELEIREHGFAASRVADRDLFLHAVDEEGALEVVSAHDTDSVARMRRHEDLRIDAGYLDVRGVRNLDRQSALGGAERVGIELPPLVALADDVDDAEEGNDLAVSESDLRNHEVVKFEPSTLGDSHPKLQRSRILGAKHDADRPYVRARCFSHGGPPLSREPGSSAGTAAGRREPLGASARARQ